ncbi:MAG TPA: hypothetical protein VMF32_08195 [Xanthobacteraceae bacterium]|nr:hypothetical protein [Xanthobacteraceae bacterium]
MGTAIPLIRELLSTDGYVPRFSRHGLGNILADIFDDEILGRVDSFPHLPRGRTLIILGDFSGHHRGQHFDTYSFLVLDLDCNGDWLGAQRHFRQEIFRSARRMSFKGLNDIQRRNALIPFLRMAFRIEGCLILFAISKAGGSLFGGASDLEEENALLSPWKPAVQERLLRIVHLSAFTLSGLSAPNQDLLWIIDQDDIASNVTQLTQLTEVFARVFSNYASHGLRHVRCGTTASDDGSLYLEDLASIADLTAGALGEICTGFINQSRFPVRGIVAPFPKGMTWKSRLISSWMAYGMTPLRRLTCIIELRTSSRRTRVTMLKWHAIRGEVFVP